MLDRYHQMYSLYFWNFLLLLFSVMCVCQSFCSQGGSLYRAPAPALTLLHRVLGPTPTVTDPCRPVRPGSFPRNYEARAISWHTTENLLITAPGQRPPEQRHPPPYGNERAVRILLKCILVVIVSVSEY